jgi:hypothetical protein
LPEINQNGRIIKSPQVFKFGKPCEEELPKYERMSEFLKGRQMRPTPLEERLLDEEFMVSAMPVHKFNRQQK